MAFLSFKQALYEIFTAEMLVGGSLYGLCDGILPTGASPLPSEYTNFLVLDDFSAADVRTGELTKKFRQIGISLLCCSVVKEVVHGEAVAEYNAYVMAVKVRSILKNNQKLVSTTYPDGLAKNSHLSNSTGSFVLFADTLSATDSIILMAHIEEVE